MTSADDAVMAMAANDTTDHLDAPTFDLNVTILMDIAIALVMMKMSLTRRKSIGKNTSGTLLEWELRK